MWSGRPEQDLMSLGFCTVSTSATSERVTQLTFNCQLKLISAGLPVRSFCWVAQWLLHTDRKWCAAEGRLLQVMWPALHGAYRVLTYLWEITWGVHENVSWKDVRTSAVRREFFFPRSRTVFFCFLLHCFMFVRIVIRLLLSPLDSREILLQNFLVFPLVHVFIPCKPLLDTAVKTAKIFLNPFTCNLKTGTSATAMASGSGCVLV